MLTLRIGDRGEEFRVFGPVGDNSVYSADGDDVAPPLWAPAADSPRDQASSPILTVNAIRGRGSASVTYALTKPVILNGTICDLVKIHQLVQESHGPTESETRANIWNERRVWQLKGQLLLALHISIGHGGLFGGLLLPNQTQASSDIWCTFFADAGEIIPEAMRHQSVVKEQIIALYSRLHKCGIIHGDVAWRHIRKSSSTDDLHLIDFDRAQMREDLSDQDWETLREMEVGNVRSLWRPTSNW